MKKYFNIIILFFSLTAMTLVSCDDDSDTEKPVISLIEPCDGDRVQIGNPHGMHIKMDLTDNEALGSYKIDIHSAAGHTHNKAAESHTIERVFDDIAGKRNAHVHQHDIVIPEDFPEGEYHFMVYCVDAAGNESYVVRTIELTLDEVEDEDEDED